MQKRFKWLIAGILCVWVTVAMSEEADNPVSTANSLPQLVKPVETYVGASSSVGLPGELGKVNSSLAIQPESGLSTNATAQDLDGPRNDKRPKKTRKPSAFQQFIQEATGKSLQLYGHELFDQTMPPLVDGKSLPPPDYVLAPGDEIRLQLWGGVDYLATHIIDRQGQINLPKAGAVTVAGLAVKDLEANLKKRFSTVYTHFQLSASPGRLRGMTVYVLGQAEYPGAITLPSTTTLINAVLASGGPSNGGSLRNIELKRGNQKIASLDLYQVIAKGDKSSDMALQHGDTLVYQAAGPRVALSGAIDNPAIYELLQSGGRLQDLLALGGGVPRFVDPGKVQLERVNTAQQPPRQVQRIALDDEGLASELKDGDIVTFLPLSPAFGNTVTLQGAVAQPLRHRWFAGMRVADLIPEKDALITFDYYRRKNKLVQYIDDKHDAGAQIESRTRSLVDEVNWDYAVVERLDVAKLKSELIPFNLGLAIVQKDPQHNLILQPGDVVTIVSQMDLRLPLAKRSNLVRIEGEVAAPGVYALQGGETLPKLIARIGGLTGQAYLFGAELKREQVRLRQQQNLDDLIRKLEADYQSLLSKSLASTGNDAATNTRYQEQQNQAKARINQLKQLKSEGRIALELDPGSLQNSKQPLGLLPEIPLEDGDRIYVPPTPSFVYAVGSVLSNNAMVYRLGKTVGDVLLTTGLSEDADEDAIFVLRADGTIISKRNQGWLRGIKSLPLMPGDAVVVPAKLEIESGYQFAIRSLKDWTQIISNLGIGVASLITIRKL